MSEEPISERRAELSGLRWALNEQYGSRLQRLEERLDMIANHSTKNHFETEKRIDELGYNMDKQLSAIGAKISAIAIVQNEQTPNIKTINRIIDSGLAMRWVVIGLVGLLATLATLATAYETLQRYLTR